MIGRRSFLAAMLAAASAPAFVRKLESPIWVPKDRGLLIPQGGIVRHQFPRVIEFSREEVILSGDRVSVGYMADADGWRPFEVSIVSVAGEARRIDHRIASDRKALGWSFEEFNLGKPFGVRS